MADLEARIERLETTVAYQEQVIDDLKRRGQSPLLHHKDSYGTE